MICFIAGFPLPVVEWTFKKCPDYPKCEESYTLLPVNLFNNIIYKFMDNINRWVISNNNLQRNMYLETLVKETFLTSKISMNATETGILACNALNDFGNDTHETEFFVTGKIVFFLYLVKILNYSKTLFL